MFIHSWDNVYLNCFQFLAVTNSAAKTFIYKYLHGPMFLFLFGWYPGVDLLIGTTHLTFFHKLLSCFFASNVLIWVLQLSIPGQHLLTIFIIALLVGMQWYLLVVWICIPKMTYGIDYLYTLLLAVFLICCWIQSANIFLWVALHLCSWGILVCCFLLMSFSGFGIRILLAHRISWKVFPPPLFLESVCVVLILFPFWIFDITHGWIHLGFSLWENFKLLILFVRNLFPLLLSSFVSFGTLCLSRTLLSISSNLFNLLISSCS